VSWWGWFGKTATEELIEKRLTDFSFQMFQLIKEVTKMSAQLDALKAQVQQLIKDVQAEGDVVTAAIIAINGLTAQQASLSQQLQDAINANDPAVIQEIADAIAAQTAEIVDQTAALAAAIPAAPAADPVV
jgi:archaellum component FlaC